MEVISVILMFVFGNMNDQATQMTQYIPMESLSKCMKEVRLLKKKNTGYDKDMEMILEYHENGMDMKIK